MPTTASEVSLFDFDEYLDLFLDPPSVTAPSPPQPPAPQPPSQPHAAPKRRMTAPDAPLRRPEFLPAPMPSKIEQRFSQWSPSLDMTTALSFMRGADEVEKADSVIFQSPSPPSVTIAEPQSLVLWAESSPEGMKSLIEACISPIRAIQDDLVDLFFKHVHPICPLVDEFSFTILYRKYRGNDELFKYIELPLFQAVLFAAFAHVSDAQLKKTPFKSVHEGQCVRFNMARTLYKLRVTTNPLVLTQVTLLLTLWSPCDSESQVNSYWLDRAFHHAREAELWNPKRDSGTLTCRRNLLWWCCLVRDRMLANGMRRPHRLQEIGNIRGLVTEADFGLESSFPSYSTLEAKKVSMSTFIWLCKLSEIMAAVAALQSRRNFECGWDSTGKTHVVGVEELGQVMALDQRLEQWKSGFEEASARKSGESVPDGYVAAACIVRVIGDGLSLLLYQPYIDSSVRATASTENNWCLPLKRLEEGSNAVTRSVRSLLTATQIEAIPAFILSWIALPAAIYSVLFQMNGGSFQVTNLNNSSFLTSFIRNMSSRFQGARFILDLVDDATGLLASRTSPPAKGPRLDYRNQDDYFLHREAASDPESSFSPPEITEAEILALVSHVIDTGLANDIHEREQFRELKLAEPQTPSDRPIAKPRPAAERKNSSTKRRSSSVQSVIPSSPRALIKHLVRFKDKKVSQSAVISEEGSRFDFDAFLRKARSAILAKEGAHSKKMSGQVVITSPEAQCPVVELDLFDSADWVAAECIIAELWNVQNKRQITVDIVADFS